MPAEKNTLLRIVVPVVIALGGVAIVAAGYLNSLRQTKPAPIAASAPIAAPAPVAGTAADGASPGSSSVAQAPGDAGAPIQPGTVPTPAGTISAAPEASPGQAPDLDPAPAPGSTPAAAASAETTTTSPASVQTLRARTFEPASTPPDPIGDVTPGGSFKAGVTFTLLGAGVQTLTMADYFETIERAQQYEVQRLAQLPAAGGQTVTLSSLAAREIEIDGQYIDLFSQRDGRPVWRQLAPGAFEAEVIDQDDRPVVRLRRAFELAPGSFELSVRQSVENVSGRPLSITWRQYGPIDLHEDISGYGLDMRRLRKGFLLDPSRDPSRQIVQADGRLDGRAAFIKRATTGDALVWPRPGDHKGAGALVWLAQTSRYFVFAVYPLIDPSSASANVKDPSAAPLDKALAIADQAHAVVWGPPGVPGEQRLLLELSSAPKIVPAGATLDLSFAAYAGPLGRRQLSPSGQAVFGALGLSDLVIYNLGGMCAFCTFQWLAKLLLGFLTVLHDVVVHDWAIAIMILVVCVRTLLHPITRRSQISMARFAKQMQALAPKQQKLREKYKDDPKRMQQEMIKLMREEQVSYTGALGCLPMFLQSPVWIALYAMLYFSFDLRHEAAYFGVFQRLTGGAWGFLGDLSVADHFIYFGRSIVHIPLLGHITGLNILPLLLGVVFFIQQKYLTPPPSASLTPEQEMQQKMIKWMTVIMFPVLMYNAPSGLTIYFITNSTLGIIESRWVRSHINQLDLLAKKPASAPLGRKKVQNVAPTNPFARLKDGPKRFKDR